jgi:DNA recombination protein RmuC
MDGFTVVALILSVVILAVLVWLLIAVGRLRSRTPQSDVESSIQLLKAELVARQAESLVALRSSIDNANRLLNERLAEGTSALDRRMAVFSEIDTKLGQLSTQARNIETIGGNISTLSELLRAPKMRGNLGEFFLENLLAEILPATMFETQYRFASGLRVDAVIRLGGKLVPIDAKFPLESYERLVASTDGDKAVRKEFAQALKRHIDAISSKYIRPDEKTTEFAIMYVPAEAVYYQLVSQTDDGTFDYALSKKVIPSSPGHLYGFLASIAAISAETRLAQSGLVDGSRQLLAGLTDLADILAKLERYHERMNGSLRSLSASFEKARSETSHMGDRLEKLRHPEVDEQESTSPDSDNQA